jgi:hypothetical protein
MRRLSAIGGDPIASGIDAYAKVTGILDAQEDRARKRTLMEEDLLDRQSTRQRQARDDVWKEEDRRRLMKERADADQIKMDSRTARLVASARAKIKSGKGDLLDDDEISAIFVAKNTAFGFNEKPAGQDLYSYNKTVKEAREMTKKYSPLIANAMSNDGGYISRDQAPDWFNKLEAIYGPEINSGLDKTGQPAKSKSLERLTFSKGMLVPELRVETASGEVYFAPATAGRDASPNAKVLQIPLQLFDASLQQKADFADDLDFVLMKLGDKEALKRDEEARVGAQKSRMFQQAEDSVWEFVIAKGPAYMRSAAGMREAQNVGRKRLRELSAESKVPLSEDDITKWAGKIAPEQKELQSTAGKTMVDRQRLVETHGPDSDQVKRFDELSEPKKAQEKQPNRASLTDASMEVGEDGKPTPEALRAKAVLDDMDNRDVSKQVRVRKLTEESKPQEARVKTNIDEFEKRVMEEYRQRIPAPTDKFADDPKKEAKDIAAVRAKISEADRKEMDDVLDRGHKIVRDGKKTGNEAWNEIKKGAAASSPAKGPSKEEAQRLLKAAGWDPGKKYKKEELDALKEKARSSWKPNDQDLRQDGTKKGKGWLGAIPVKFPEGKTGVASEYSVTVDAGGKKIDIPTLVPTLTKEEIRTMTEDIIPNRKKVPAAILKKAMDHARKRADEGKSPFVD